jgi:hypothetical protein
MVYQMYLGECQDKLTGKKAAESITPAYKLIYTSLLWQRATMDNIISKGLSTGRSSSYTLMQNKFDGKQSNTGGYSKIKIAHILYFLLFWYHYNRLKELCCSCCTDNEVVFPAMEAFKERVDNPTNYFFYDYFLRASVGEKAWKQATGAQEKELSKRKDQSREEIVQEIVQKI